MEFTTEQVAVVRAVCDIVEEAGPDHIYTPSDAAVEYAAEQEGLFGGTGACVYFDPAEPDKGSCLFGQAFIRAGVTTAAVLRDAYEGTNAGTVWQNETETGGTHRSESGFYHGLNDGQGMQDDRKTWGEARSAFLKTLRREGFDVTPWEGYITD